MTYQDLSELLEGKTQGNPYHGLIQEVVYDSRKIYPIHGLVFFALAGTFRNGHDFIPEAYAKGVRIFVIENTPAEALPDASYIVVTNVLDALQKLAHYHRNQLTYPIVAIAGSLGKTTVKEWLYHLLSGKIQVYRSPKSYNSQLGVALSILNLPMKADLALIEVAATKPGEMQKLADMVRPTHGILTNLLTTHCSEFSSFESYQHELCSIFNQIESVFVSNLVALPRDIRFEYVLTEKTYDGLIPFQDEISLQQANLAINVAQKWTNVDEKRIKSLPHLAMRLETFEGISSSLIINDTYTMDQEAFKSSLSYQLSISGSKRRIVLIGLTTENNHLKEALNRFCQEYQVDEVHFLLENQELNIELNNSVVLVKGARYMQRLANRLKYKQHKTQLSYNLSALKHNLYQYKSLLQQDTKMLAMVKAQSYGVGLTTLATYLEKQGIHYFGVAYSDEGHELRKAGIQTPILVMNAEEEGMETCVQDDLEPAIYDFKQLDELLKVLIAQDRTAFPIHIKMDTGMKRLGFHPSEVQQLIEILASQPEVMVKSVYSHLADADQANSIFTQNQLQLFDEVCQKIEAHISYPFFRHILNSEGIAHYASAQFDMVRMGIGLFGLSSNQQLSKRLKPVILWTSSVSQVKTILAGESVGYGRSFVAEKDMRIGIIPIGYADGFKRELSNGAGAVYIQNMRCPVVGRVCMDMIMVDLGELTVDSKTVVEIIGPNQPIEDFAQSCHTIPYEILTSISPRVHRTYSEEE
ncbi:MAG: alanine racemase [Bacteroidota bacterium]